MSTDATRNTSHNTRNGGKNPKTQHRSPDNAHCRYTGWSSVDVFLTPMCWNKCLTRKKCQLEKPGRQNQYCRWSRIRPHQPLDQELLLHCMVYGMNWMEDRGRRTEWRDSNCRVGSLLVNSAMYNRATATVSVSGLGEQSNLDLFIRMGEEFGDVFERHTGVEWINNGESGSRVRIRAATWMCIRVSRTQMNSWIDVLWGRWRRGSTGECVLFGPVVNPLIMRTKRWLQ